VSKFVLTYVTQRTKIKPICSTNEDFSTLYRQYYGSNVHLSYVCKKINVVKSGWSNLIDKFGSKEGDGSKRAVWPMLMMRLLDMEVTVILVILQKR
jgi:hypothetical protein